MAVYLCKMCGGSLDIDINKSVCKCSYCDTMQAVPRLVLDSKAVLLARAEHYRRCNEYDQALSLLEQILAEDRTDADIYWAIMLCRYGIEYVEDIATGKRIPTINRVQYRSVLSDEDYKNAIRYADDLQRTIYQQQAQEIEKIQMRILAVSRHEEPFDIFLCCKESGNRGKRTQDSIIAGDLYQQLTANGYRVFFARITLEDKPGTAYEPYIFAALNSAKVMVVVTTSVENLEAVWVRNEWSRFLAIATDDPTKALVTAYKDIDPSLFPKELSYAQMMDISAPDFTQELFRGIRKLVKPPQAVENTTVINLPVETASLIRRAYLFLEDSEFSKADMLCERVLDMQPDNAEAYLVKLMSEMGITAPQELARLRCDLSINENYKKAIRFADDSLHHSLEDYNKDSQYNMYLFELENADSVAYLHSISEKFAQLGDHRDAQRLSLQAMEMAERLKSQQEESTKSTSYISALDILNADSSEQELSFALKTFERLGDYKQSSELAEKCREKIEQCQQRRIEHEHLADEKLRKTEKKHKLYRLAGIISATGIVAAIIIGIAVNRFSLMYKYNNAQALIASNDFVKAIEIYKELGSYSDAQEKIIEAQYLQAIYLRENGEQESALIMFEQLGSYVDSKQQAVELRYEIALACIDSGEYAKAITLLSKLGDYSDSANQLLSAKYNYALLLCKQKDYESALVLFQELGDHADSKAQYNDAKYELGIHSHQNGNYEKAIQIFSELQTYKDSNEQLQKTYYDYAVVLRAAHEDDKALDLFEKSDGYSDAIQQMNEIKYASALSLLEAGEYDTAIAVFEELDGFADSADNLNKAKYERAERLWENGLYDKAIDDFKSLGDETVVNEKLYLYAHILTEQKSFDRAVNIFYQLGDYKDSKEQTLKTKYLKAVDMRENGFYSESIKLFTELGDYSDSYEQIAITERYKFYDAQAGQTVVFGRYNQEDFSRANNNDELEWIVLAREGTRALVITKYCIDVREFGGETWETSTIRTWLNNDFFYSAFNAEEQKLIPSVKIETADNAQYGTNGGADTTDKVFLLSEDEVEKYLPLAGSWRRGERTEASQLKYIDTQMAFLEPNEVLSNSHDSNWWLRSPGSAYRIKTITVRAYNTNGVDTFISDRGEKYNDISIGVRPVIWIDMGS